MRFIKRIIRRFEGDPYISKVDEDNDSIEIVKEFAACYSCGTILRARDILTCDRCNKFICTKCKFDIGFRILCKNCLRESFPLTIYEYVYLDVLIKNGSLSLRELTSLLNENQDVAYAILHTLIYKGLVREFGFIIRYYSPTLRGIIVRNIYKEVYDKHVQ